MLSNFCDVLKRIKGLFFPTVYVHPATTDIIIEQDVTFPFRDKNLGFVNIYRPNDNLQHPVIICCHPYGKDKLPKKGLFGYRLQLTYHLMEIFERYAISDLTTWESPDPDFWVRNGFIVINADERGAGKTPGKLSLFSDQEAEDYYDLIEWAAKQSWSNGKVGLCGVSYLAISQYKVAALNPPSLHAICPWEGFSNLYKDLARPGGIREDGFFALWTRVVAPTLRKNQIERVAYDSWWQSCVPDLKNIKTPALICASFSDQNLHTNGSFRVFSTIKSKHKWLYTHRTNKWAAFYSDEAKEMQLKFFNYFLKDEKNDLLSIPPVRLCVNRDRTTIARLSYEDNWPLSNTVWQPLYLNVANNILGSSPSKTESNCSFQLRNESIKFDYVFTEDCELSGPMKLTLYLSVKETSDMNIFIGIRKFDENNNEVYFIGSYGYPFDIVTKGYLKASFRKAETDNSKINDWEVNRTFDKQEFLEENKIISVEIPLLQSATLFKKNEKLQLQIAGNAIIKQNVLLGQLAKYESTQKGIATLYTGGKYNSYLLIPIINHS